MQRANRAIIGLWAEHLGPLRPYTIDAGLAVAVAVAVTIAIGVSD